jgi:hypothetical protein
MRRAEVRPIVLMALVAALTPVPASASASVSDRGKAHAARTVLVSAHCGLGVRRPRGITLACADNGLYLTQLRWSRWGGRVAVADGILRENTCDPFCLAMNFVTTPVGVHLFRRRECPGRTRLYYTRGTLFPPSGRQQRIVLGCP